MEPYAASFPLPPLYSIGTIVTRLQDGQPRKCGSQFLAGVSNFSLLQSIQTDYGTHTCKLLFTGHQGLIPWW